MRVFLINRSKMTGDPLTFPGGGSHDPQTTIDILDRRALPDGFPFLIEDDGRTHSCASANQYFLDALDQRAFKLAGMTNLAHSFNKFLTTIRRKRAADAASAAGQDTQEWLSAHGEPRVDLTDVTREDLIYYRDTRQLEIAPSTLAGELQRLSSFFIYALHKGWITVDPIPRWGQRGRNTLVPRVRDHRVEKFLSGEQTTSSARTGSWLGQAATTGTAWQPSSLGSSAASRRNCDHLPRSRTTSAAHTRHGT